MGTLLGPESHKVGLGSHKATAVETSAAAPQEVPASTAAAPVVPVKDEIPTPAPASTADLQKAPAADEASSTLQDEQSSSQVPIAGLVDPVGLEVFGAVEGPMAISTEPLNAVDEILRDAQRGEESAPLQRQLQQSSSLDLEKPPEAMVKTEGTAAKAPEAEKLIKDSEVQKKQKKACCC